MVIAQFVRSAARPANAPANPEVRSAADMIGTIGRAVGWLRACALPGGVNGVVCVEPADQRAPFHLSTAPIIPPQARRAGPWALVRHGADQGVALAGVLGVSAGDIRVRDRPE
jgi:hypothetical protein